jgi:hypothetical protein
MPPAGSTEHPLHLHAPVNPLRTELSRADTHAQLRWNCDGLGAPVTASSRKAVSPTQLRPTLATTGTHERDSATSRLLPLHACYLPPDTTLRTYRLPQITSTRTCLLALCSALENASLGLAQLFSCAALLSVEPRRRAAPGARLLHWVCRAYSAPPTAAQVHREATKRAPRVSLRDNCLSTYTRALPRISVKDVQRFEHIHDNGIRSEPLPFRFGQGG